MDQGKSRLFRKVLVPYDFSPNATRALRTAAELAVAAHGRLIVLHAVPPFSRLVGVPPTGFPPAIVSSQLVADQQRRLEARVGRVVGSSSSLRIECRAVVADPVRAILDAAGEASVIVMGTLGLTGLAHLVIGSVAERVVRHAPVPVLTVRVGARGLRRPERRRHASVPIAWPQHPMERDDFVEDSERAARRRS
jgi:nucleotide-binding universal stress UspA family protein